MPELLRLLLRQGNYFPFMCIITFSFVLPFIKFILIAVTLVMATCSRRRAHLALLSLKIIKVLRVICKYQLVDVFAIVFLLTFINFVGISAEPLSAIRAYQAHCVVFIVTTHWLCHCYSETLERHQKKCDLGRCCVALSSPLLARRSPVNTTTIDGLAPNDYTTPLDTSECSTTFMSSRPSTGFFYNEQKYLKRSGIAACHGDVQQRAANDSHSLLSGYLSPHPVGLPGDFSGRPSPMKFHPEFGGKTNSRIEGPSLVGLLLGRAPPRVDPGSDALFSLSGTLNEACLQNAQILSGQSGVLSQTAGEEVSNVDMGRTNYLRCSLLECRVRILFLVLSCCIFFFSMLVCWIRPIMQVSVVPGQQRDFAIDTLTMSLGNVFWRMYSLGYVASGCGTIVVFPLIVTFVSFAASLGSLVGACFLQRSEQSCASFGASNVLSAASPQAPCRIPVASGRAIYVTRTLSSISALAGDVAMPDVLSMGLLTAFFIFNSIDFFGARIPGVSLGRPNSMLERLLWNFSGFWGILALGFSASQVHRLSTPFEGFSQDMRVPLRKVQSSCFSGIPSPLSCAVRQRSLKRSRDVVSDDSDEFFPDEFLTDCLPTRVTPADTMPASACISTTRPHESIYRKTVSFWLILHGCARVIISLTLVLPIWLKPVETVDVDLSNVVSQHSPAADL